jgi:hypothetical protein
VQQADVRVEGNSGVVVTPGPVRHLTRTVAEDGVAEVPLPFTIRPDALPAGTEVGIDLLRIGDPDDVTANMTTEGGVAWDFTAARRASLVAVDPATGNLGFRLKSVENGSAALRPVARIMRKTHRFRRANSDPADGTARYTVRLRVRSLLPTRPYVRFDLYRFDDSNPLRDPESQLLRRVTVPLAIPTDGRWHTISVDVPQRAFMPVGGRFVNSAMVYLGLPKGSRTELVIDRLQVVEWRNAETFPPGLWLEADALVPPGGARSIDALVR